ncbi:MAG: L,D-transpeptidase family protein [Planctomycetaceae bacterium]
MKPFAMKSGGRVQLHWWVVAGIAAAFFVWSFDLIPRVHTASSGSLATSDSENGTPSPQDETFDNDWAPQVRSHDAPEPEESELELQDPFRQSNAPSVRSAHHELTEPEEVDEESGLANNEQPGISPRRDPDVTGASYEGVEPSESSIVPSDVTPKVLPADVAAKLRTIDDCLKDDLILDAHAELSEIYWKHPELRSTIDDLIRETASLIFTSNERQFGTPHHVEYGETLQAIAKQYEVPWQYLALLNRVTPEKLQAGQELKIVRGPFGAVVDLSAFTLTVHAHGWYVNKYRIGTGRDHKTPLGEFVVEDKLENPTWYNPDGGIVEPDDPENPLGEYWLGLGNHIGIHGTNDPSTIGRAASRGCIHLGDSEIEEVFSLLSTGSKVLIRK